MRKIISLMMGIFIVFGNTTQVLAFEISNVSNIYDLVKYEDELTDIKVVGDPKDGWVKVEDYKPKAYNFNFLNYGKKQKELDYEKLEKVEKKHFSTKDFELKVIDCYRNNNRYDVYGSNNNLKVHNEVNLYKAIQLANTYNSYVKENTSNKIVFRRSGEDSDFYCFQFNNFYKNVNTKKAAEQWVAQYSYSHVFNGKGQLAYNSYTAIKDIPAPWGIEPNSGGYFYKYSWYNDAYKKSYSYYDVDSSRFKFASDYKNNAYIFKAAVISNEVVEFGVMTAPDKNGDWILYCKDSQGFYTNSSVIPTSSYKSNGKYYPRENFELTLYITKDDRLLGHIKNASNTVNSTYLLKCKHINYNSPISFLDAVSFVPDEKYPNLENGAFFKNVIMKNSAVYRNGYQKLNFYANSGTVSNSFIYNNDVATYSRNGTSEIINISYEK